MSETKIEEIVRAGLQAPSGDNCHPWKFIIGDNKVSLINLPQKDSSLYSYGQKPSLISHGAAVENIVSAAELAGLGSEVLFNPDKNDPHHIADVLFHSSPTKQSGLGTYIYNRVTNRKPYYVTPLNDDEIKEITASALSDIVELRLVHDEGSKAVLTKEASLNEKLVLTNKHLHHFLFSHVQWSEAETIKRPEGMFVKAMEIMGPQKMVFKLASNWTILRILNLVGLDDFIAGENAKIYKQSASFGALTVTENSDRAFFESGRVLQRIWLTATKKGLYMHPLTGIVFLMRRVESGEIEALGTDQIHRIKQSYETMQDCFDTGNILSFMFRIGHADPPSARSKRKPLNKVIEKAN